MNGILYMDVSVFEDVLLYEKGKTLLSAERRMYMEKLKNPKAASLSLGAGVLLFFALQKTTAHLHPKRDLPPSDFSAFPYTSYVLRKVAFSLFHITEHPQKQIHPYTKYRSCSAPFHRHKKQSLSTLLFFRASIILQSS